MVTFSGEATLPFSFLPPLPMESTLKGKKEKILSFKSKPYIEKAFVSREANRKSRKSFPFVKMEENIWLYQYTLRKMPHSLHFSFSETQDILCGIWGQPRSAIPTVP